MTCFPKRAGKVQSVSLYLPEQEDLSWSLTWSWFYFIPRESGWNQMSRKLKRLTEFHVSNLKLEFHLLWISFARLFAQMPRGLQIRFRQKGAECNFFGGDFLFIFYISHFRQFQVLFYLPSVAMTIVLIWKYKFLVPSRNKSFCFINELSLACINWRWNFTLNFT